MLRFWPSLNVARRNVQQTGNYLGSGTAAANEVATADGAGGIAWAAPTIPANVVREGDNVTRLGSGAVTAGQIPTATGAGAVGWSDELRLPTIKTDTLAPADLVVETGAARTIRLVNRVFNDINVDVAPRNTGAGRPNMAALVGNVRAWQFEVNDFTDITPLELMHDWAEGTELELHLHWATGGNNDATPRGVQWQIEYAYAPKDGEFVAPVPVGQETAIAAGETGPRHKYTSVTTFTPAVTIGTQLVMRITRIAAVAAAPAADPFLLSFGLHYEIDTIGSRTRVAK